MRDEKRRTTPYFAYGSNLDRAQMERREVSYTSAHPAVLKDFKLAFTARSDSWAGGVADVVEAPGSAVEGVLYQVSGGMESLDLYEGVADGFYRRKGVEVHVAGHGGAEPAVIYEVCEKLTHQPPSARYMDAIIRGALEGGLSEAYVDMLKKINTIDGK